jgi:sulfite reductase (NADPH) flavoprotein alpha-component
LAHPPARLLYREHRAPREPADHEFPVTLTTGRVYAHWHTLTRTAKVRPLVQREPQAYVEIHPELAARLDVLQGDLVQISSRRGTVRLPAQITDRVPPGLVFVPLHWGDRFSPGNAVNYLTISAIGRVAKQPELKYCAVAVERVAAEPRDLSADVIRGLPAQPPHR